MLMFFLSAFAHAQGMPEYNRQMKFDEFSRQMNQYYKASGNKTAYYKQWKRLEWYYSTRLDATGKIPAIQDLKQDALRRVASGQNARIESALATTGNWTFVGPTSVTSGDDGMGRVNRLAFHPSNPDILFAATAGGGLWKTTNGGTSWAPLTDGLPNMNLSGVVVHKTNTNIIYILTGDGDGSPSDAAASLGKFSTGVLKSDDGGNTWKPTGLKWEETDDVLPFALVMHPSNFNIIMAATNEGLWRSSNGGSTWTNPIPDTTIYDIEFMPFNGQIVYAAGSEGRFYKSEDGGLTWTRTFRSTNPYAGRVSIAVSADNSSAVYMLISNNEGTITDSSYTFNGLFYSNNYGNSWTRRASRMPNVFDNDGVTLISGQQNYDHALAVSPFNEDIVITGGIRLFRSTNGGSMLSFVNNTGLAPYHVDIHELTYGPASGDLYAATDGGVYKSDDDGSTWVSLNGNLAITQYYRFSISTANSNYILAGAQDNGTHLRNSNSSVFTEKVGKDGMDNAISLSNPSVMYASAQNGDFRFSTNSGSSFSLMVTDSMMTADHGINTTPAWVTPIAVSNTNAYTVFLGFYPLVKGTYLLGWNFTDIGTSGSPNVSGRTFLKLAPGNANIIYAADRNYDFDGYTNTRMMWRSSDGGATWKRCFPGLYDDPLLTDLAINPDDPKEIWVSAGNFIEGQKVYRSLDSGQTWTNISGSLPNIPINTIVYDDNNGSPNDALYIGTDIGVFYRDNTLGDWVPYSTGLPVVEVTDLEIDEAAGMLKASTYGRGIWQTPVYSNVCVSSINLVSHTPSSPHFYNASTSITSSAEITGVGAHIQYKSGQRVLLTPGFRVDAATGAKFVGYIGSCTSGGMPPVYRSTMNGVSGYLID